MDVALEFVLLSQSENLTLHCGRGRIIRGFMARNFVVGTELTTGLRSLRIQNLPVSDRELVGCSRGASCDVIGGT